MFIKCSLSIALLLLCANIHAQQSTVEIEDKENGYLVYGSNEEYCPVSLKVDFTLTNLKSSKGNNQIFVLPARSEKVLLTELNTIKEGKAYEVSTSYLMNYGDHSQETYDLDYDYYLPFNKNESFEIYQGYNGDFSHKNENALDFTMPVGTEIVAVREGVVVQVVQSNSKACPQPECVKYNNYILIYHPDGTFAEYSHISKNGAKVKVGDTVKKGHLIANSGHVGWSTGPHLHLVIFQQKLNERRTLETMFLIEDGSTTARLEEKKTYSRNY